MELESWIPKAIAQWRDEGVNLNSPASISEIEHTENVLQFKFPNDFRQLYLTVNGFQNWDMQDNSFSFWPLDRIIEEFNEDDDRSFIGFSDWLIRCTTFGFMRETPGVFKSLAVNVDSRNKDSGRIIFSKDAHGKPTQHLIVTDKIAETFKEFVFMVNIDSNDLY